MIELDTDAPLTAPRVLIHGAPKSGKSSLASGAPKPIVIDAGSGTAAIRAWDGKRVLFGKKPKRYQPASWTELLAKIDEIGKDVATKRLDISTLVLDEFGRVEELCSMHVCENWTKRNGEKKQIKNIREPGYGDGEVALLREMRNLIYALESIQAHGVGIVIICHSTLYNHPNNEGDTWKAWGPALTTANNCAADVAGFIVGWCDIVGYLELDCIVKQDASGKRIGHSSGKRVLTLAKSATVQAGCRYPGVDAEIAIPPPPANGWRALWSQVEAGPLPPREDLRAGAQNIIDKMPAERRAAASDAADQMTPRQLYNRIQEEKETKR